MLTRRQVLKTLTTAAIASTTLGQLSSFAQAPATPAPSATPPVPAGPFKLPPLPYAYDALEPYIDAETMHLHHDKHHAGYVNKLNEAVAKDPGLATNNDIDALLTGKSLSAVPENIRTAVRNQGGGHANHSLFWLTLSPRLKEDNRAPKGELATAIDKELGGLTKLQESMAKAGAGVFGSGWAWFILDQGKKLSVISLPNQDSPLTEGHTPLFGIDVWEHAYYLKYHNLRADYITAIWNVVNWDFISDRYATALKAS